MQAEPTPLDGVRLVTLRRHGDSRGFFIETWNQRTLAAQGIAATFVQDNQSRSVRSVLRGLHYQVRQPQAKLVRCSLGEVFDVAVDLRRSSPSFGRWFGVTLSADNLRMLFVPEGFAHGFVVTSEVAELQYKVSEFWAPEYERSLRWDDPAIGIRWPLAGAPILSAKDAAGVPLADAECFA